VADKLSFEPALDSRPSDTPWPQLTWPPPADTNLVDEFVELRPADAERDAAQLFTALDHDAVWAHVAGRPSNGEQMAQALRTRTAGGMLPWIVRLARPIGGLPSGAVVGMTSYLDVSVSDARLEIGWTAYSPHVWATAVNPAAKLALLGYAFEQLGAGRVQLKTDVRNQRSQRAIAKLGASYEGTLRRFQRRADDTIRDTVLFGIVIEQWPTVRTTLQSRLAEFA
jgi:RimJ/RimL family protein N-acetyltransferase